MHKTGTTSFQKALRNESARLLACNTRVFTPRDKLPVSPTGFPKNYIAELISNAASEGVQKLIISHEGISLFNREGVSRLRAEIGSNPASFIVVFRHWCTYLPSRWAQNCKRRDSASFFSFMESIDSNRPWMRFDRILTTAQMACFDHVLPISFDTFKSTLLDELCKACELDISPKNVAANKSHSLSTIEKLRLFNAARAVEANLPRDELLIKLTTGKKVENFFDQGATVIKILEKMTSLDMALEKRIRETQSEMVILPERFSSLNRQLEEVAQKVLFPNTAPHQRVYSSLEFDHLEADLRAQLILELRRAKQGLASKVKEKITRRFKGVLLRNTGDGHRGW